MSGMTLLTRKDALPKPSQPLVPHPDSGRDERTERDRQIVDVQRRQISEKVEEALAAASIVLAPERKETIVSSVAEIKHTCERIRENYIDLGRSLLKIYRQSPELYEEITRRGATFFPFDYTVAIKCRKIAEALDASRITLAQLPSTYTVAYEVVTMEGPMLAQAAEHNLLRPDVSRREIVNFKHKFRDDIAEDEETVKRLAMVIAKLEGKRDDIITKTKADLARIDEELKPLWERLKAVKPDAATLTFEDDAEDGSEASEDDEGGEGEEGAPEAPESAPGLIPEQPAISKAA